LLTDQFDFLLIEPGDALAVFPQAILDLVFLRVEVRSQAVLLALVPPTLVEAPVGPIVEPVPALFVVVILPLVATPIGPEVDAVALHVVILPLTVEAASVFPEVNALAEDLVVNPVAFVGRAIGPGVEAEALLLALDVLPVVL